jgi:hypothetical protein
MAHNKTSIFIFFVKRHFCIFNKYNKKYYRITKILDENNYINKNIDFLSIDVEGHDFEALLGLDFKKYRPGVICIEIHDLDLSNPQKNIIVKYLNDHNYSFKYYAVISAFFVDNCL